MSNLLNPTTVISPFALSVATLFANNYKIPENQRDFAWKAKQIEEFFSDLFSHYRITAPNHELINHKGYFIGSTVVTQIDQATPWMVVDGQQRYTVLSITIAVLRELVIKRGLQDSTELRALKHAFDSCLYSYEGGGLKPRMSYYDEATNDAYVSYFVNSSSYHAVKQLWNNLQRPQQKKSSPYATLYSAYRTVRREILKFLRRSKEKEERNKKLFSFARMILEYVIILQIRSFSYEETYQIFQSLNDRGLKLSQADLVKNEVLKSAQADRETVLDSWNDSKEYIADLEGIALPELLHYSFLSRYGDVKAAKLFPQIKERLNSGLSAKDYTHHLETDAHALMDLVTSRTYPQRTNELLEDITKRLGHQFVYPILLSLHRKFVQSPVDFEKTLIFVRSFLIRYMIVGEGTPEGLAKIAYKVGEICRRNLTNSLILNELSAYFVSEAPDAQFVRIFKEHSQRNSVIAGLLISDIENHLSRTSGVRVIPQGATSHLEHIMPKKVNEQNWPDMLALQKRDPDDWRALLWSIGNLMMLPQKLNQKIQNKGIEVKMEEYRNLPLQLANLTPYLSNGKWDGDSIKRRQEALAVIAPDVWPLT